MTYECFPHDGCLGQALLWRTRGLYVTATSADARLRVFVGPQCPFMKESSLEYTRVPHMA